ncbi:MAG: copper-binding protein [Thiohalomonadaceae bacterium]
MRRRAFLLAATLAVPAVQATEGFADFPAQPKFHGEGILNRVDRGVGVINISHGPVAFAGWSTMTRDLRLKPKALANGLIPGMHVRFRLQAEDGRNYSIVAIEPITPR